MPVGQVTFINKDCNKKHNIFVLYREKETLNETEMRQIMKEYGKEKKSEQNLIHIATNNREL